MPQIPKGEVQPHQLHGVAKVDANLSFRQRMRDRWRPTDTVKVHNVTSERLKWQWLDENDEDYTIEDDTNIKITNREDPSLWYIEAGETDILIGANAYMAVDAMYKMVCIMKTGVVLHPLDEREIRNFSMDDPEKQEEFLEMVFQGKVTPAMMQQAAASQMGGEGRKILEQLTPLATESEEYHRREKSERGIVNRPGSRSTQVNDLASEFKEDEPLMPSATGGLPEDRRLSNDPPKDITPEGPKDPAPSPESPTPTAKKAAKEPATAAKPTGK